MNTEQHPLWPRTSEGHAQEITLSLGPECQHHNHKEDLQGLRACADYHSNVTSPDHSLEMTASTKVQKKKQTRSIFRQSAALDHRPTVS